MGILPETKPNYDRDDVAERTFSLLRIAVGGNGCTLHIPQEVRAGGRKKAIKRDKSLQIGILGN